MKNLNPTLQYRPDLDGLRAIAVIAVVAFHALPHRFPGGFIGVDVFFVISGFLISTIILTELNTKSFSYVSFYSRRIRRLFPALLITILGSWIAGWFLLEPRAYASLGANMLASAAFISNIFLYSQRGYFAEVSGSNPLLHLWSLGIEEQFYLAWPMLLLFLYRSKINLSFSIAVLIIISFVINILAVTSNPMRSFYLPFGRFWELLFGAWLACLDAKYMLRVGRFRQTILLAVGTLKVNLADLISISGLALTVLGIFLLNEQRDFPGYWAIIPVFAATFLILSGPEAWLNRTLLSYRWLVTIGLISYPLYLTHWPLLTFSQMFEFSRQFDKLRIVMAVTSAVAVSYFIYIFIEKPLRAARTQLVQYWVHGLLFAMILVGTIGYITTFSGVVSRYPEAARVLEGFHYDYKKEFRESACLLSGREAVFHEDCWQNRSLPQVLIWGDSHGAMVYRALIEVVDKKGFGVAQYTSSSCPPVLEVEKKDRPLCKSINDDIFEKILEIKPRMVILAHDWVQSVSDQPLQKLPETIARLRNAGVQKILIIGPVPRWHPSLSAILMSSMRRAKSDVIPERLLDTAAESMLLLDASFYELSKTLRFDYLSPRAALCNKEGCLVSLINEQSQIVELTAFDDAHLMPLAARLLIQNYKNLFD